VIISLDSEAARDAARTGGKASTLARLRAAGFPVPEGFVVTADDGLNADLVASLEDLERRAGPDARFAVRSSSRAEDSVAASFAGQYDTVLGVRGADEVSRAITRCFASFSNPRASVYQSAVGVPDAAGAVIVQRLVPAEAAGVAFTRDPVSGARDRVVIDAGAGLGDAVVSGRVTPDGFVVMKASGDVVVRRPAADRPGLGDQQVQAIADLAGRVEDHEGGPVDIEWAWHGDRLYLLQARPITAIGAREPAPWTPASDWTPELNTRIDPRFPLYSNGNVSEILPGCVPPLTYSLFARGVERGFRSIAETIGSMPDVGPNPIVVGFFFHRLYLNVSYFMTAADNSPGATRDTVYEDLIGPSPEKHPAWRAADLVPWRLWRGLGLIGRFLAMQGRLDKDLEQCRELYVDTRRRFDDSERSQWPMADVLRWIEVGDDDSLLPVLVHLRASQCATSSFSTLRSLTRRWLADAGGADASWLVTGIGAIAGANPVFGLHALARLVADEPALRALFRDEPDDTRLLEYLGTASDGPASRLSAQLDEFVERFGHRGFREADFRSPTWRERPALVLGQVRAHLHDPSALSPVAIAERQEKAGADARAHALARLPAWKRVVFASILDAARKHIAAREEMKDLLLKFIDLRRRVLAVARTRLAAVLDDPDDIYFLLDGEVAAALRGELARAAAADIVRRRRRDFEWCERIDVPKVQEGVARWEPRSAAAADPAARPGDLSGLPVSPGIAEGRARVVLDPTGAVLAPGEILVAPVTDVAWTPMFLHAAGLVVEVGGPLSHGSIVAREFGIPAVTAVAGATRRIRSGDRVRVDGSRGVVAVVGGG
jgi:pyruvate,water dikinase